MCSLCTAFCSYPVLALTYFTKSFNIESDASDTGVGGVFIQEHASVHKLIAFLSKTLTSSETTVYTTISCLQSLLDAKLGAPALMGNELLSSLIKNLSFTSTLTLT